MNASIAAILAALTLTRCMPTSVPFETVRAYSHTEKIAQDAGISPESKVGKVVKDFRREERAVPESVSSPVATASQIRDVYLHEHMAYQATQQLINKGRSSTKTDEDVARDAIDGLRRARRGLEETSKTGGQSWMVLGGSGSP